MIIADNPFIIVKNASLTISLVDGALLKAERARGDSIYAMSPDELERKLKKEGYQGEMFEHVMNIINLFWETVM